MQQIIQRGTGTLIKPITKDLAQPLAGKTGTTSNYFDAWFVGFSPDLVAGTYVGFDEPRTLGDRETGGRVAAGIFRDFMREALKGAPAAISRNRARSQRRTRRQRRAKLPSRTRV